MDENFDNIIDEMSDKIDPKVVLSKGKNSRSEVIAYGIRFDSKEELDFHEWVLESVKIGFIENFIYQPESIVLFDGVKDSRGKYLIRPHIYSPDYKIVFTDKWLKFKKDNKIKVFNKFDEKKYHS